MTTPQIYGLFAMLTVAALAGIIFYCIGLRTGRDAGEKQGKEQARAACEELVQHHTKETEDLRSQLYARTREAMTLRNNIKAEAEDHAKVERDLLNRLAAAAPLAAGDHATLLNAAGKLQLAASTFASIGAHDHARTCSDLKSQVLDMAARTAEANAQPHPDSELIDWLDANAALSFDFQTANLYFEVNTADLNPVTNTLREVVRRAIKHAEEEADADANREDAA